jgi:hypothetical protein
MKWTTGQRAAILIQGRLGRMPRRGTAAYSPWICAQQSGRVYLSHVWDCPQCNPFAVPPEHTTTVPCHRAESFFTEAMVYRSAYAAMSPTPTPSRIHKNWRPTLRATPTGHLSVLIRA